MTNLLEQVLEHAWATPDAVAVAGPDGRATYRELTAQSARLAAAFDSHGVGPGDLVGLLLPPGRDWVAAALAAFRRRAAYVPMDPEQPAARVADILQRCGARVCVGAPTAGWTDWTPPVMIDPDGGLPHGNTGGVSVGSSGDVAYVIHTSGSTGRPKGVQIEHANMHNLLLDMDDRAPVAEGFTGSWWASPDFDASAWEVWSPLSRGGTVCVPSAKDRWEGNRFAAFLDRCSVVSAFVPPTFLPDLRDHLALHADSCRSLRRVLTGVEPIPLGILQELLALRGNLTVVNGYGPAEATVCTTLYVVPRTGGDGTATAPIGTAVRGNELTVLDPDGRPADTGTGELVVVGRGVGRGYLMVETGERERFFEAGASRGYRTGDRVRIDADGLVHFLGRIDRMLKVRGYRVEPGEIEAAIRLVTAVRAVVVDERLIPGVGRALVGYVVPARGEAFDPVRARVALATVVPAYAVPTEFILLDELPLVNSGKIDHAALARLPLPRGAEPAGPVENGGGELGAVLNVWRAEMGQDIPTDAGFRDLGGTSLSASRIAAALRTSTGREVSAVDVLSARSSGELADLLAVAGPAEPEPAPPTGRTTGPLSPNQLGLWMHDQLDRTGRAYLEPLCFLLPDGVQADRLADAICRVVAAHPVFAAAVARRPEGLRLVLGKHAITLRRAAVPAGRTAAERRDAAIRAELDQPFDLDGGPLMRAVLLTDEDGPDALLLAWHHLAIDGWSVRRFLADLGRCHDDPEHEPLPSATTICDANVWLGEYARSPMVVARIAGVVADLGAFPVVPARHPNVGEDAGRVLNVRLGADRTAALRLAAPRAGLLPSTLLGTAYLLALSEVLGTTRLVLGHAVSGRVRQEFDAVSGYFVNTVLIRPPEDLGGPVLDMATGVAKVFEHARATQEDIPFGQVVAGLRSGERSLPRTVPQLYFSLDEDYLLRLGRAVCRPHPVPVQRALFDANLVLRTGPAEIHGSFEHRLSLLSTDESLVLLDRFQAATDQLIDAATTTSRSEG